MVMMMCVVCNCSYTDYFCSYAVCSCMHETCCCILLSACESHKCRPAYHPQAVPDNTLPLLFCACTHAGGLWAPWAKPAATTRLNCSSCNSSGPSRDITSRHDSSSHDSTNWSAQLMVWLLCACTRVPSRHRLLRLCTAACNRSSEWCCLQQARSWRWWRCSAWSRLWCCSNNSSQGQCCWLCLSTEAASGLAVRAAARFTI